MTTVTAARIEIGPAEPALDTPLSIGVTGLPPGQEVALRSRAVDPSGQPWTARARFRADASGQLDLATAEPVTGDYPGADPMGLVWSMRPDPQPGRERPPGSGMLPPARWTLTALVSDTPVAEATVQRHQLPAGIRRTVVRAKGLVGSWFTPIDGGPRPGVILVGGSEGGLHEPDAALLAGHGFSVLALAYFGMRGVPRHLVDIPLEYFGAAVEFLSQQRSVRGDRLGIMGGSRGGEAALLAGATSPQIGAVVSTVGSGVMTQCIGPGRDLLEILQQPGASWTYRGQPLPYLPYHLTPLLTQRVARGEPVELAEAFRTGLTDPDAVAAATIPVERIQGGVLLVSAGDDRMWPCRALSEVAAARLDRARHPYPFRHLTYPDAGHPIAPPPYGPATDPISPGPGVRFALGGTPAANARARADAWTQSIAFLQEQLAD